MHAAKTYQFRCHASSVRVIQAEFCTVNTKEVDVEPSFDAGGNSSPDDDEDVTAYNVAGHP